MFQEVSSSPPSASSNEARIPLENYDRQYKDPNILTPKANYSPSKLNAGTGKSSDPSKSKEGLAVEVKYPVFPKKRPQGSVWRGNTPLNQRRMHVSSVDSKKGNKKLVRDPHRSSSPKMGDDGRRPERKRRRRKQRAVGHRDGSVPLKSYPRAQDISRWLWLKGKNILLLFHYVSFFIYG